MAIATSNIAKYEQNPKFYDSLEMQYREKRASSDYYGTKFEAGLKKGDTIKLDDSLRLGVTSQTGHSAVTYATDTPAEQSFTVSQFREVGQRMFDVDADRSVFDIVSQVENEGNFALYDNIDNYAFQKLKENAQMVSASVDLTAAADNAAAGNLMYDALMDTTETLDAVHNDMESRKTCLGRNTRRFLREASRLTHATDAADKRIYSGTLSYTEGMRLDMSNNIYQDGTSFNVTVKGLTAVGSKQVTVDNAGTGTINAPKIGDTIVNVVDGVSRTMKVITVKTVTTGVEYTITLDQVLGTALADNATLAITGYHTDYVPVMQGTVGQAVIQKDPSFQLFNDPVYHAKLFRGKAVFDHFLTTEGSRRLVVVPFKHRTIA